MTAHVVSTKGSWAVTDRPYSCSARLLSSLLFGVTAADPVTFLGIAAFLTLIGILACYVPARKAASVDPLVALRNE